jgi:hypothetical protein
MLEILGRVVAIAEAHVHARSFHLHFDVVPFSVVFNVRADVVAQQVVAGVVRFHALERIAQIAQIEEGLAAGIGGKRSQRIAGILAAIHLLEHLCAPVKAEVPLAEPVVASPPGISAISPRESTA